MAPPHSPAKKKGRARGYIQTYRPQAKTRALLEQVQAVLDEYRAYWPITARQLFYRLVGAHGFPKDERACSRLYEHLVNARRARVIPFHAIRDDGVSSYAMSHFADADDFRATIREQAENFRRDLMANQDVHVEIWCEAAGMIPQLFRVGERYSIKSYSSSGFDSVTAKKQLADRICETGKPAKILHLGDYDPSGEDIFTAAAEDVQAFVLADRLNAMVDVEFIRVALTEQQVKTYRLPTSPAKESDSRSKRWRGQTCQLEALAPNQIAALLTDQIERIVNVERMEHTRRIEAWERQELSRLLPGPVFTPSRENGDRG